MMIEYQCGVRGVSQQLDITNSGPVCHQQTRLRVTRVTPRHCPANRAATTTHLHLNYPTIDTATTLGVAT